MWRKISFGAIGAAAMLLTAAEAESAGCLKAAVVGGIGGHFAGHHVIIADRDDPTCAAAESRGVFSATRQSI